MLAKVGIQVELEYPDSGGYNKYRFNGWSGLLAQHTRNLPTINLTNAFYWPETSGQFPSLQRPEGLLDVLNKSLGTPTQEAALGQQMTQIMADNSMIIPLFYVTEMYALQTNVHDTGYFDWSATTVYTPEKIWLSK
jgi:ABC-type transport system substrate-binding protein